MEWFNPKYIFDSVFYSIIGIVIFWVAFIIIDKLTPYQLWKEIIQDRNMPLAIIVAAMCLSIAIIISSAIHG